MLVTTGSDGGCGGGLGTRLGRLVGSVPRKFEMGLMTPRGEDDD